MHSGKYFQRVRLAVQQLRHRRRLPRRCQPTLRQDRPTDRLNSKVPLLLATLAPAVNDLLERRCGNYGTP